MGSTGSRPRLRKVAPCNSLQEEGAQPEPQWTLPALPVTMEQPSGSVGRKKTILPPLRQEITLSSLSGNLPPKQSNNPSIIHSHPPRRPQALQPLALQIGHTSTANHIAMGRDCRDGGVHLFSTIDRTGHSGTGRMIQGGFLEAQTALTKQAHRHRRAHLRQAREQRRHKVVYTVNGGGTNTEGMQRLKLVRRPTERDIFWDETTGESLDPSCLLDPISLPRLCEERQPNKQLLWGREDRNQRDQAQGPRDREETAQQSGHKGLSLGVEDRGKAQRESCEWPDAARSCQTARIRGVGGMWDYKLD
ncbi:uncharacterized protein LOC126400660 [Epinephelus moara]|uniref:uncharacterized protein LOC126400660 n=1 Tax=Epinephelus moara TaxID=300413 RepID=UPI00214F2729|nr:uncharacterized protein LOC126400660 [Epinephelus moara]